MKIFWIVNTMLNALSKHMYKIESNGLWMSALLEDFKEKKECELVIVTTAKVRERVRLVENGITYYALPDNPPLLYDENKKENIEAWANLIAEEQPDLIQVWGTEFTHGLCALRVAGNIPSVIYMQGYLGSIAKYYLAGISKEDIKRTVTFRDVLKRDGIVQQQKKYYMSMEKEKEMLQLAGRIISENEWCNSSIRAIVPKVKVYYCPLSVNQVFERSNWDINKAQKYTIVCNASGYPLKGLHMVFHAVALLKKKYPEVKVCVPGTKMVSDGSIKWWLRKRGYTKYIEKLIKELDISKQIVWLGNLSQEELAEQYENARVFVLGSAIENHSSSLKEAMLVGTPSVASAVGGIPEYVCHGENAFLYRFGEYEIMADYVSKLFEDDELANKISKAGRQTMRDLHENAHIYEKMVNIYQNILEEK